MIRQEPALLTGAVTAAIGLLFVYGLLDERQASAWTQMLVALLPILSGAVTRFLVFAPRTLEKAGLHPSEVQERAKDPEVRDVGK